MTAARVLANPGRAVVALGRSLAAVVVVTLALTALALTPLGVGLALFPPLVRALTALADHARRTAPGGPPIPTAPAAVTPVDGGWLKRQVRLTVDTTTDPAFWRTAVWALLDCVVVWVTVLLPLVLFLYGLFGIAVQPFVWRPISQAGGNNWYGFVHVTGTAAALWAILLGVVFVALAVLVVLPLERGYRGWLALLLAPTPAQELRARNRALTATRADVVDDREAGLARIQRDLHDGAQARLVAMGMSLDHAVRALHDEPERARLLLTEAQALSTTALSELRALVHGIHSPVLADRGLGDAVRSLVLDTGFDGPVTCQLPSRPAPPVEAAAYFAVSELIANAAKHARAQEVTVDVRHDAGILTAVVTDDGAGGADPARGTGLIGVERRLAAFDGTLAVDSPAGGPTRATVRIPCALS